ncbi:MAG TPA: carbon starvation protein A, partial [Prevotellaceae bacterium]|nr:carbon starvation protein A [Prevotellaceae bacterium]
VGRPIFYGAMITEGIVALIWATVSMFFFYGSPAPGYELIAAAKDTGFFTSAPAVVNIVCNDWLGVLGATLALLGVVAAPITSGDTAFRSARLIIADFLHLEQQSMRRRLYICIPLFAVSIALLLWQIGNPDGFNVIWQYFGWANQTLSVFTLWTLTVYLAQQKKPFVITLVPALFMTVICSTFLFISKQAFNLGEMFSYVMGIAVLVVALIWFFVWYKKHA